MATEGEGCEDDRRSSVLAEVRVDRSIDVFARGSPRLRSQQLLRFIRRFKRSTSFPPLPAVLLPSPPVLRDNTGGFHDRVGYETTPEIYNVGSTFTCCRRTCSIGQRITEREGGGRGRWRRRDGKREIRPSNNIVSSLGTSSSF